MSRVIIVSRNFPFLGLHERGMRQLHQVMAEKMTIAVGLGSEVAWNRIRGALINPFDSVGQTTELLR